MVPGIPLVRRVLALTAPADAKAAKVTFQSPLIYLMARNKGANIVRMYFTAADFTADANYVELPVAAATAPHGEWNAPVEVNSAGERDGIWFKAASADTNIELVGFQRR